MGPRLWNPDDHVPGNSQTLVWNTDPAGQAQPCWHVGPKSSWKRSDPGTVVSCSSPAAEQSVGISCTSFRKALNLIRLFTSSPYLNLLDPPKEAALPGYILAQVNKVFLLFLACKHHQNSIKTIWGWIRTSRYPWDLELIKFSTFWANSWHFSPVWGQYTQNKTNEGGHSVSPAVLPYFLQLTVLCVGQWGIFY